ncbi:ATP-grasp domain-containing protein [Williamsia deligens]|uniref:ATP-grasp enzyme n=1 Tax=Williamsia deligens TaxID=321325 RepID=A0ABW3GC09_9NOCA|nr:ATP-grasp enzyme [Williamsia deligens]MCP2195944.1 Carbamoylphosphate synthase large subunit [Williamsia deligens]
MTPLREANAGRTAAALLASVVTLAVDAPVVAAAVLRRRGETTTTATADRRTVLVTGGKMTKSLALVRAFHAAGHRVVLVESAKYRHTGHRYSRAVDAFHTTPETGSPDYVEALARIVDRERVDVVVPVSSPASSVVEAAARSVLDERCEVLHGDVATIRMLDDKAQFSTRAEELGLSVPHFARISDPAQIDDFPFRPGCEYILKRIAYNPVGRMDLTRLRAETPRENAEFARRLHITPDDPWILQQFIPGREYCTHGTVRDGRLQVWACCESSAFQINYAMVEHPRIRAWVEAFLAPTGLTGQASFDFIEADDGEVYAIECNPRTHSAITMFYDHPDLAAAYLQDGHPTIVPTATSRPTHWIYHEVWRLLTGPDRRARWASIRRSTDAIFSWSDPLPFLMVHHLHIPSLLLANLRARRGWTRIDLNIGKLVENGGD